MTAELGRWLAPIAAAAAAVQERLEAERVVERIWQRDHTVWPGGPQEVSDRLGWLDVAASMRQHLPQITQLVDGARRDGFRRAVVLGMGGSSLAPEVCAKVFGVRSSGLDVAVLDSTSPAAVADVEAASPADHTLFVVATKSGDTVETLSFAKYFYGRRPSGSNFVAVTDPGSGLADLAAELAFRETFLNDPEIGGRYSALSLFGLVPAALLGLSPAELLDAAEEAAAASRSANSVAAHMGGILGAAASTGRDKLMLVASPAAAPMVAWVEQLVAESTGKQGRGILPVAQPLYSAVALASGGSDRLYVLLDREASQLAPELSALGHPVVDLAEALADLQEPPGLAEHFFVWELAVAVAGHVLAINPFDQPNVESAKVLATEAVAAYQDTGVLPSSSPSGGDATATVYGGPPDASPNAALQHLLRSGGDGRYVGIQAFLSPDPELSAALENLAGAITAATGMVATHGYGPRFLHSTGQLHKGDGGGGLFLQLSAAGGEDLAIPDQPGGSEGRLTFGVLLQAQVQGDGEALRAAGRSVLRLDLQQQPVAAIQALTASIATT